MDSQDIATQFYRLQTDLDQFRRYYAAMRARCSLWSFVLPILWVLTAFSTYMAIAGEASSSTISTLAFLAAVWACLSLAEGLSRRTNSYLQKQKSFSRLLGLITAEKELPSVDMLRMMAQKVGELKAEERPLYGCLSVLCHNEACEAFGMQECINELTWMQRHIWRFFPVPYIMPRRRKNTLKDKVAQSGSRLDRRDCAASETTDDIKIDLPIEVRRVFPCEPIGSRSKRAGDDQLISIMKDIQKASQSQTRFKAAVEELQRMVPRQTMDRHEEVKSSESVSRIGSKRIFEKVITMEKPEEQQPFK